MVLESTDGDNVTAVIDRTDAEAVLREVAGERREVSTNAFMRALVEQMGLTFEAARDEVYRLLDSGRVKLTSKYTLRLSE